MADPTGHAAEMPEHWSWFSFLPEEWHEGLRSFIADTFGAWGAEVLDMGRTGDEKFFYGGRFDVLHVWGFIFVLLLLIFVAVKTKARLGDTEKAIIPEDRLTVPTFAELFTGGVYNTMVSIMGKEATKFFLPLIGTCAFVILFSNVLGLIPGFLPPTDNLNTTAAMAIIIFCSTHIFGVKKQGFVNYMKHFMGPIPVLAPLIFVIELVSHIVRPVTLSIRLTANMFADHAVLGAFLLLSSGMFFIPFPVAVYFLGIIVVLVQTLVFCLLSMVYIGAAIEDHAHH